ncbi:MAG: hypothetical protein KJN63_05425, partial [Acidimicrobiia bacterium]|nr:hypothetical protein [Acidimicrobiia bacterium]
LETGTRKGTAMPNYVLTYHGEMGSMPDDPEAMAGVMAAWETWYGTIGADLVDGGAPFGETSAVGPDGAADAPASMTGYTIIKAADMAAARSIASGCPVLAAGHTVQISESIDM